MSLTSKLNLIPKILKKLFGKPRKILINNSFIRVPDHWFWQEFDETGWEPFTKSLIDKYVTRGSCYVDIGVWVGVTVFYAAFNKPKKIIGVEANPETVKLINQTISYNQSFLKNLEILNFCVTNRSGDTIGFGSKGEGGHGTSSSSAMFRDHAYTVTSISLRDLLRNSGADDFSFMKIDIEGAELLLANDLVNIAKYFRGRILLALHPTFWHRYNCREQDFWEALSHYKLYSLDEKPITINTIKAMSAYSGTTPPPWGTKFGNFFDILLAPVQ